MKPIAFIQDITSMIYKKGTNQPFLKDSVFTFSRDHKNALNRNLDDKKLSQRTAYLL